MNKQLIAFFILFGVFASSDVYASRARVLVEGTGDSGLILGNNGNMGSFYADDAYNMFYNPAYVNDYKNFGIIEKSNFNSAYTSAGGNNVIATSGGTTAEGGFVTSIGNYSLGLYMNRTDVLSDAIYQNPFNMRPIDVMIGGDNGLKWGLGLTYSSYKAVPTGSTATSTDNDVVVRPASSGIISSLSVSSESVATITLLAVTTLCRIKCGRSELVITGVNGHRLQHLRKHRSAEQTRAKFSALVLVATRNSLKASRWATRLLSSVKPTEIISTST
jgi:hypothetical protein